MLIACMVTLIFVIGCVQPNVSPPRDGQISNTNDLLRICPQEKISNQMPCICSTGNPNCAECANRGYYILNGQRAEIKDFDVEWVKSNCQVVEHTVY